VENFKREAANSNGVFYKSLFGRCVHEIFLSRFSEIIFQIAGKVSFTKNSVGVVDPCYATDTSPYNHHFPFKGKKIITNFME